MVDFAYLEAFAAGDRGVVREVLVLFREQAQAWAPRLAAAGPDWRDLAHTIKGAGRGVGALALGDACARAEAEGEAELPAVQAALADAVAAIDAYLARG
jgi:HPt (histidine-containing phosphotransfer) domain-containing protein